MHEIAIVAFKRALDSALKIKEFTGGEIILYSKDAFRLGFKFDAIIAIMAAGIAVRSIAPLVRNKWDDPSVVVVDSGLNFAIPVLGGHHGGNELAKKLQGLGIVPVITTATEAMGRNSVENIARILGSRIVNRNSTKKVNTVLLEKDAKVLCVKGPKILLVGDDVTVLKKNGLVVGIGANRGVSEKEVLEAVSGALSEIDADIDDVQCFASAAIKEHEKGIIDAAASFGKDINFVPHDIINSINAPTGSRAIILGLNGVCEPAALALSEEKELLLKKRRYGNVTIAIAR